MKAKNTKATHATKAPRGKAVLKHVDSIGMQSFNAYDSADSAAQALGSAVSAVAGAMKACIARAVIGRDVADFSKFVSAKVSEKTAKEYVSNLNTIRTLSGAFKPEQRLAELDAMLASGFKDFNGANVLWREAVGGIGAKPAQVLSGSGATRALLDTVEAPKSGAMARVVKAKADAVKAKADAEKAERAKRTDTAPAGKAVDTAPAGKAEPSEAQKLAPRASFALAIASLTDALSRGKWVEPLKAEKLKADLAKTLSAIDAQLKDK